MVAKQRTQNFAMAFAHKLSLISKRARQRNSLKRYYELEHKCVCLNLKKGTPERIPFLTFCDPHGGESDPFGVAICTELSLICHHSKHYNKLVFNDIRNFCKKYGQFVKYQVVTHW